MHCFGCSRNKHLNRNSILHSPFILQLILDSLVEPASLNVGDAVEVDIEGYYYPGEVTSKVVDDGGETYFTVKFAKACGWSAVSIDTWFLMLHFFTHVTYLYRRSSNTHTFASWLDCPPKFQPRGNAVELSSRFVNGVSSSELVMRSRLWMVVSSTLNGTTAVSVACIQTMLVSGLATWKWLKWLTSKLVVS